MHYLSVRNMASNSVTANVTLDLCRWALPGARWLQLTNLYDGGSLTINLAAGSNSVPLSLQPSECQVFATLPPAATNALLSGLSLSAGGLIPDFAFGTRNYSVTNAFVNNPVQLTATSADPNATLLLSFNGGTFSPLQSGVPNLPETLSLNPPLNTLTVLVTAQDGGTNSYTVNVTQQPSQTPPPLTSSVSGGLLTLTWPSDHVGYRLLVQTNNLNQSVSRNPNDWGTVNGSTTNNIQIIRIDGLILDEFYQLIYPQ